MQDGLADIIASKRAELGVQEAPRPMRRGPLPAPSIQESIQRFHAPPQDIGDWWRDYRLKESIPFLGPAFRVKDMRDITGIARRQAAGEPTTAEENERVSAFMERMTTDKSFGYKVMDVLAEVPALMVEYRATSGAGAGARTGLQKLLGETAEEIATRTVERKLLDFGTEAVARVAAAEAISTAAGAVTGQGVTGGRAAENTYKQILGDVPLEQGAAGLRVALDSQVPTFLDKLPEGALGALFEVAGEMSGPYISKPFAKPLAKVRALQVKTVEAWMGQQAGRTLDDVYAKLAKGGFNGMFAEVLEERVTGGLEAMATAAGVEGLGSWEDIFPGWEQLAVELTAFSIPGVTAMAAAPAIRRAQDAAQGFADGPRATEPQAAPEAQEEPAQAATEGPRPQPAPVDLERVAANPRVGPLKVVPQEEIDADTPEGQRLRRVKMVAEQLGLTPTFVDAEVGEFAGLVPSEGSVVLNRAALGDQGMGLVWHEASDAFQRQDPEGHAQMVADIVEADPQGLEDARERYAENFGRREFLQLAEDVQLGEAISQRVQDLELYLEFLSTPKGRLSVERLAQTEQGRGVLARIMEWLRDMAKRLPFIQSSMPTRGEAQAAIDAFFEGTFTPADAALAKKIHARLTAFGEAAVRAEAPVATEATGMGMGVTSAAAPPSTGPRAVRADSQEAETAAPRKSPRTGVTPQEGPENRAHQKSKEAKKQRDKKPAPKKKPSKPKPDDGQRLQPKKPQPQKDRFAMLQEMEPETRLSTKKRELVDEFDVLRVMEKWIVKSGGRENRDVWHRTGNAPGTMLHMYRELEHNYIQPVRDLLKKLVKSKEMTTEEAWQALADYVDAAHTPDRAAVIRERREIPMEAWDDSDPKQTGTGLSINEAREIVKNTRPEVAEAGKIIQRMNVETRRLLLDHGHISQAEHDAWAEKFGDTYAPQRDPEDPKGRKKYQKGTGFSRGGPEAKRAEGRSDRAGNSAVWSIVQAANAIERVVNGDVGRAFLGLLRDNAGIVDFKEVVAKADLRDPDQALEEPGEALQQMTKKELEALGESEVFWVKENGKDIRIDIRDERIARAMKRLGRQDLPGWVRGIGKWNAFQRSLITTYNPAFIPPNFVRDWLTAMVNVAAVEEIGGAEGLTQAIANPAKLRAAYKAMYRYQKRAPGEGDEEAEWDRFAREAAEDGMLTGYGQYRTYNSEFEKLHKELYDPNKLSAAMRAMQDSRIAQFVEDVGFSVENMIRLVVYRELRQQGFNRARAAGEAKDLTTNFNRKGEVGGWLNSLWLFGNAGIQGNYKLARVLMASGKARRRALGIVAGSVALSIINNLVADDDENGQSAYASIPEYIRANNFIIMEPGGTRYIKIPLPYGYNVLANLGRLVPDAWFGAVEPGEALGTMAEVSVSAFSPLGGGPLPQVLSPTITDPAMQLATNQAWHGGRLWPEYPGDMRPDSQVAFRSTPGWSKAMAAWINEATGGDTAAAGMVDVHPQAYNLLYQTLTGSTGRFLERVAKMAISPTTVEPSEIPILRRFAGSIEPQQGESLYYENSKTVERALYRIKMAEEAGDRQRARQLRSEFRHLVRLEDELKRTKKLEKKFRDQAAEASGDAKERAERRRIEVLQAFNRKFYSSEPGR